MKKKLLFVNDVLSIGGVEISLLQVLNHLDYEKVEVDLYILHPKYDLLDQVNQHVKLIRVRELPCKLNISYLWFYLWMKLLQLLSLNKAELEVRNKLSRLYKEKKRKKFFSKRYDIAIAYKHSESAEFVTESIDAGEKVVFYHQGDILDYELHKRAFETATTIVAVSEGVADMLSNTYPNARHKIIVIENLIDSESIRTRSKEYKPIIKKDRLILVTCGRLNPEKGFDLAITAAKMLSKLEVDFHWYFVGDGTERLKLEEQIIQHGLDDQISITGMLKNPLPYIAACDIYVQPSYSEAFGLTIAEAQVLGKPIISTATIGAKHLIAQGVTGIITDCDGVSIGNAICELFKNHEKRQEILENLKMIDYSNKKKEFQYQWQKLIEL